jgi:hypothetical protein
MSVSKDTITVTWEKLPADYRLPDDPVDNIAQPLIAAALTDSLENAGRLPETAATTTDYGICATLEGNIIVKAPDWSFIPRITVPRSEIERSYTPNLQGDPLLIVMEFLSATESEEFSVKKTPPVGKWFFYEQVLRVPIYAIFDPDSGSLEVNRLNANGIYRPVLMNEDLRYWIEEINLFLGVWRGTRSNRSGYWLRWWDESGQLLLWGNEGQEQERQRADEEHQQSEALRQQVDTERQRANAERQRANAEHQRSQLLAKKLRELGVDPDTL